MIEKLTSTAWWRQQGLQAWAKPELRWLAAILVLALALRIVWVLYAAREPQGLHDQLFYVLYGDQIANGNGYRLPGLETFQRVAPELARQALDVRVLELIANKPTAYYPVGYPAALGGVFALVKHTPIPDNLVLAGAFFQVFLGVATVALVYQVGQRLFSPAVGLVAALWLAIFPNLIFHTATLLSETLFNFLVMAALAVLLSTSWRERRLGWGRLLVFGTLLGISALVRPISLLFLPLLLVVWLVAGFGWRRSLGHAGAVLAMTALVITPWAIRNAVVMEAPIIISANLGDDLCIGHYPGARGHFAMPDHCFAGYEDLERPEYEVRRNSDNIRRAVRFALENPRFELKLLSRKAWYLWEDDHNGLAAVESYGDDPFIDPGPRTALARIADIFYFVTISLGGLGLVAFVAPRREPRRLFFLLALLALAGVPLAFFGAPRFHVPVMPLLVVSAAWAVVGLRAVPRLASGVVAPASSGEGGPPSGAVEVAEGEPSVADQDALQDS